MLHARILDADAASAVPISLNEGATLNEALAAAGVMPRSDRALSQNGRKAGGSDALKPGALVTQMPRAYNG